MTPLSNMDRVERQLEREIAHYQRSSSKQKQPPPEKPPAPSPIERCLANLPSKPLTWLWPGRIPLGHLTLLDAAPGSGLSLFALTLAACVSSGSPLPDGTPTHQSNVILFAPYDSASDTITPRLQAAGGDPAHILLLSPLVEDASHTFAHTRSFAFPHDLDYLASIIHTLGARLLILDPASAIPGLARCLPALIEIAHQTNCAILLTRSLRQSPVDPLHAPGPASPLLEAARSRLLLAPDPADERRQLLLTTKHPLCMQPAILAYDILASESGIPTIHWLGEQDYSHLARLCTGPLRSPHRQAILRFLQNSTSPQSIQDILKATSYDDVAGRKMLERMRLARELVSPARGLYTTANHPCLVHFTGDTPPVPNVPTSQNPPPPNPPQSNVTPPPAVPVTDHATSTIPPVPSVSSVPTSQSPPLANSSQSDTPPVPNVPSVPTSQSPPPTNSPERDVPDIPAIPVTDHATSTIATVPNVPNPAQSTSEVAQQPIDTLPAPLESPPEGNGTS